MMKSLIQFARRKMQRTGGEDRAKKTFASCSVNKRADLDSPDHGTFMELSRSGGLAISMRSPRLWILSALLFAWIPGSFALISSCGGDPSKSSSQIQSQKTEESATERNGASGSEEGHEHHQEDGHGGKDSHESHEGHDVHGGDGSSRNAGPDMAVLEAHETKGIRLAHSTVDTCEIGFSTMGAYDAKNIPPSSRIRTGEATLVYVMEDTYIYPVLMSGTLKGEEISALRLRDQVDFSRVRLVVQNSDIVHLALLEAFGASGSGHGH